MKRLQQKATSSTGCSEWALGAQGKHSLRSFAGAFLYETFPLHGLGSDIKRAIEQARLFLLIPSHGFPTQRHILQIIPQLGIYTDLTLPPRPVSLVLACHAHGTRITPGFFQTARSRTLRPHSPFCAGTPLRQRRSGRLCGPSGGPRVSSRAPEFRKKWAGIVGP